MFTDNSPVAIRKQLFSNSSSAGAIEISPTPFSPTPSKEQAVENEKKKQPPQSQDFDNVFEEVTVSCLLFRKETSKYFVENK